MERNARKKSLKIAIIAIALLLCFALAVGITTAFYQAQRRAMGSVKMDQGIIIDYKGFNKGDENIWQRETTTTFKLFEERDAQPGEQIYAYPAGIRANAESVDFYARLKLEYSFYNVVGSVETPVALANPKSLIKTSSTFFDSNWVASTDGYYYYGVDTTLSKFSKDATNYIDIFAKDGEGNVVAKFLIEGANFVGETAGEGGGFVVEDTYINKIVVHLTLETLQGDADAEAEGWKISQSTDKTVDISTLPEDKTDITIDDIISGDRDGEITIAGDPAQPLTITIGSKAFYGCTKLKLTLSNSENIIYQIASDAFSSGATIMYGLDNVTSLLVNPSTSGKSEGAANKWKVSEPNLYLFLPTGLTSTSNSYGDYQYTDDQGTWYFDLIDESGNKVSALSSSASGGVSTLGASTLESATDYTARINYVDNNSELTTLTMPTFIGSDIDSARYVVSTIKSYQITTALIKNRSNITLINLPAQLKSVGDYSISFCSALISITIPDSVTDIGTAAFAYCSSLQSITISSGVREIGSNAFGYCSSLQSIIIPIGVTKILGHPFNACSSMTSIVVEAGNSNYHSAGNCLIETATKELVSGCKSSIIPADGSVTRIGYYAFSRCSGLTSIEIPSSVIEIEQYAFTECANLASITISDGVEKIESYAFNGCPSLTSITIPDSVEEIKISPFYDCENLKEIIIGAGIKEVSWLENSITTVTIVDHNPYLVFDGKAIYAKKYNYCLELSKFISSDTEYNIPSTITLDGDVWNVVEIGNRSFRSRFDLVSITIPESITNIGDDAFEFCNSLTSITIPNSVTTIGNYAFGNCINLESVVLGSNIRRIGYNAFSRCYNLSNITIPDSVTSIWQSAFQYCTSLTSAVIGNGMSEVPYSCFYGCASLESVTLGSGITTIEDKAFYGCTNLATVIWNVTYDLGGVNATGPSITQYSTSTTGGLSITDTLLAPTSIEDGFTFEGWTDGSTIYSAGSEYTFTLTNRNLTAVWSKYIISFDANGGNGSLEPVVIDKGSSTTLPDYSAFSKAGYYPLGWSTNRDATTADYVAGDNYTPITSVKLYVIWQKYLALEYNANGGEGSFDGVTLKKGEPTTIPDYSAFSREGYYAVGWSIYKKATPASFLYKAGESFTFNSDTTLYLIWQKYGTLTLNANGGTGEDIVINEIDLAGNHYVSLSNYKNSFTAPAGGEYIILKGWSKSATGSTNDYSKYETYNFDGTDATLYAVWGENTSYLLLDSNNGTGLTVKAYTNESGNVVLANYIDAIKEGKPSNYELLGFSTSKTSTVAEFSTTEILDYYEYSGMTIYAIWEVYVTVTFSANGGVGEDVSVSETNELKSFAISDYVNFTRENYILVGFSSNKNAKPNDSLEFVPTNSVYFSYCPNDVTYYAVWRAYGQFILNANGGEGENIVLNETDSQTYVNLEAYLTSFSRAGYRIIGFSTDKDSIDPELKPNTMDIENVNFANYDEVQTFYAIWTENPTTGATNVAFDLNGGTGKITFSGMYDLNQNFTLPSINGATKEGYVFLGWATNQDATSPNYSAGERAMFNYQTYYAVWSKLITINFDLNGGEGTVPSPITTAYGMNYTISTGNAFTKEGYKFAGWALVDAEGIEKGRFGYSEGGIFYYTGENYTLKAIWAELITVTFYNDDTKSQSFTMTGFFAADGLTFPDGQNIISKEGYVLVGWNTSTNASWIGYEINSTINLRSNTEVYAVWKTESECAKIVLDLSEVDGQENIVYYGYQTYYYLPDVSSLRNASGQIIIGWSETQYNSSYEWNANGQIWLGSYEGQTLTLYPVWKTLYKITFDANGGEGEVPAEISLQEYTYFEIADIRPTKEGFIFAGWSWNASNSSPDYYPNNTYYFNYAENKTLYAIWAEKITLTFNANGGEGDVPSPVETYYQGQFDIPAVSLTKEGYVFAGWAWTSNATYPDFRNGSTNNGYWESDGRSTLYAVWAVPRTLTFDSNGGQGEVPASIQTYYGGRFDIPSVTLTKEGYTFIGWSFTKNLTSTYGGGELFRNGQTDCGYYYNTDKTLYAVWGEPVTITFDMNDGSGTSLGTATASFGETFNFPTSIPSRTGYKFLGWHYKQNAGNGYWGESTTSTDSRFISGNATIYAQWEVLNNEVFVGSLTTSELAAIQELWSGKSSLSEISDTTLIQNMSNNYVHARFSINAYLNDTKLKVDNKSNNNYGFGWKTQYYKLSTNTYVFEFENALPTGWKLVNYRYEVQAEGDVTIVDGKARATVNYSYVESFADPSDNLFLMFVLPSAPEESTSVGINISAAPGNVIDKLVTGDSSFEWNYFLQTGFLIEIYDGENNLLWLGNPSSSNGGMVSYRFATGTYKLRIYTTNVVGFGIYSAADASLITGQDVSSVTYGDNYSEVTFNYTFADGNPDMILLFSMADVEVDTAKLQALVTSFMMCGPDNVVGTWVTTLIKMMTGEDVPADELNYAGYTGMLYQNYFNGAIANIPNFSIYDSNGNEICSLSNITENIDNLYIITRGATYTIKFASEVKNVFIADGDSIVPNELIPVSYNETTGTWDATVTAYDIEYMMFLVFTADIDLEAYEDLPQYDANTDYTGYLDF